MGFFEIQLEVTSNCKLRCVHCSSEPIIKSGFSTINYPIKHIHGFINQLVSETDQGSIYFTGGEPLLCKDLLKILEDIKKNNLKVKLGLFSSGVTFNKENKIIPLNCEYVEKLRAAGLTNVNLSVYSHISSHHDRIVGETGAFDAMLQTATELKKHSIDVYFNVVINRLNCNSLFEIIALAKQTNAKGVRFLKLVRHGRAIDNWNMIGLSYEEQEIAILSLLELDDYREHYITVAGFPHLAPCRPNEAAVGCQAGKCFFYVDLFGNIYPCGCTKNNEKHLIGTLSQSDTVTELLGNFKDVRYNCYCME